MIDFGNFDDVEKLGPNKHVPFSFDDPNYVGDRKEEKPIVKEVIVMAVYTLIVYLLIMCFIVFSYVIIVNYVVSQALFNTIMAYSLMPLFVTASLVITFSGSIINLLLKIATDKMSSESKETNKVDKNITEIKGESQNEMKMVDSDADY